MAVPIRHQFHHPSHLVSLHQDLECVGAYPSPFKEKKGKNKNKTRHSRKTKADIFTSQPHQLQGCIDVPVTGKKDVQLMVPQLQFESRRAGDKSVCHLDANGHCFIVSTSKRNDYK